MANKIQIMWSTMIVAALYFLISVSLARGCSDGWEKFNGYCFLFSNDKMTWPGASETCRDFGGYLAEPSSSDIDKFLSNRTRITRPKKVFWLGASDIEKEGHWKWLSTRLLFSYTNWLPPDPNNAGPGENCLLMNWAGQGRWEDGNCQWNEYFICQAEDEFGVIG